MVEPFATIVINSLLSSRSALGHHHQPDFFTPHPRPAKGKEKATESPDEVDTSFSFIKRGERPYYAKDSPWCSKRNRVFVMREIVPRRDRPFRRHPSHHLPPLMHRRSSQGTLKVAPTGQKRYASNVPDTPTSIVETLDDGNMLHQFRLRTEVPSDQLDLELAWKAYCNVATCGAISSLKHEEVLVFLDKMVTGAEKYYQDGDLDTLQSWGLRLRKPLKELVANTKRHTPVRRPPPHNSLWQDSLLVRAQALLGHLKGATKQATAIARSLGRDDTNLHSMCKAILLSMNRRHDAVHVLDHVVTTWDLFGRLFTSSPSTFLRVAYDIFASIIDPVIVLSDRRDWHEGSRARAGELLIRSLCQKKLPEDALAVFEEMQRQNIIVPFTLRLPLVRALALAGAFEPANRLFSQLSKDMSFKPGSRYHLSTGLSLFASQGNVSHTEYYFRQLEATYGPALPDRLAMRMYAHAITGNTEQVVSLFHQFFTPSESDSTPPNTAELSHYNIVLLAHARRGDFNGINVWLGLMSRAGINPDIYTYNIVLKGSAKRGAVDSVSAVLDQMRAAGIKPNRVSYTTVITLLAHRQDPVSAEAIYQRAIREGVVPDRRMITALMNAHVEAGSWKGVIRVFDYLASAPARHIRLSIDVYNTLLKAYVLIGAPFKVVSQLFFRLEQANARPDAYTFALLIQSACDSGKMEAASNIFAEMERRAEQESSGVQITAYVLTIMMAGFLRAGNKVRAKAMYDDMRVRGIEPTSVTFGTVLKAYRNEGTEESFEIAERFIRSLVNVESSRRLWNTPMDTRVSALEHIYRPLMTGYARYQKSEDVERLFQDMLNVGGKPTLGLLTTLLDAYRRTGDTNGVLQVWPQIFQLALHFSQVKPLLEDMGTGSLHQRQANTLCAALSIYIDALSAAGLHTEIGEAWKAIQEHGFSFDSHNWNHLSVALVHAGEPERAFEIIERVILPYQNRSYHSLTSRNSNPDTPLSLDMSPKADDIPEPHTEAFRRTNERIWANRTATVKGDPWLNTEEKHYDFAHHLHVLNQISPSWKIWSPHKKTLRVLLAVILRLESGATIMPMKTDDEFDLTVRDPKLRRGNINDARKILNRIYADYPNTVQIVLNLEAEEKHRAGKYFDRIYR